MTTNRLSYAGQRYLLSADQDLGEAKRAVIGASQDGCGFVDLDTVADGSISVLIAPGISLAFLSTTPSPADPDPGGGEPVTDLTYLEWDL